MTSLRQSSSLLPPVPARVGFYAAPTVSPVSLRTIHLVRHGQSTWNLEGRLQGQTMEVPLTELGLSQAQEAAECLVGLIAPGAAVGLWSSDQQRAYQTAQAIACRLGLSIRASAALREQALGELEGRLTTELVPQETPPGEHVSEIAWGGGESIAQVHIRLSAFLAGLRQEPIEEAIVVTHGDTLRVARAVLAGRTHREVEWGVIGNGEVVTLSV